MAPFLRKQVNYNWPKLIAALLTTLAALVALAIDADNLGRYHVSLMADMSRRTAWSYGTCIRYSSPGSSAALFRGDGLEQFDFLNYKTASGSKGVCNDFKDAAARTLVANVHALHYMVHQANNSAATSDMTVAVEAAYAAVRGEAATVNLDTLSNAMSGLTGVPDTCEKIYFKSEVDPSVENATTPYSYDAATLALPDIDCDNTVNHTTTTLNVTDPELLYSMCVEQFAYLRSTTDQTVDNVPFPGQRFEPASNPLAALLPDKWNATLDWDTHSRIFSGVRFGWASWASTPSIMLSSFIFMDGMCMILAELTRGARMRAIRERASTLKDAQKQVSRIEANAAATRSTRFVFCIIAFVTVALLRYFFAFAPWIGPEAYYTQPTCESGGWKDNTSEQISDIVVAVMQLLAIVAYRAAEFSRAGEDPNNDEIPLAEGNVASDLRFTKLLWLLIAIVTLLGLALEAIVANTFGLAWATEMITPQTYDWNADKLAEVVATRVLASAAFASFGGFCLGAVVGRFLVTSSVSKPALCAFICWLGIVILSATPLLLMNVLDLFDDDEFLKDCAVLHPGSFAKAACDFRKISLTVVLGALGLIFAVLALQGCVKKIRALWTGTQRRVVRLDLVARSALRRSVDEAFEVPTLGGLVAFAHAEESRRLISRIPVVGGEVVYPRDLRR